MNVILLLPLQSGYHLKYHFIYLFLYTCKCGTVWGDEWEEKERNRMMVGPIISK
jgi:hypothetical protein